MINRSHTKMDEIVPPVVTAKPVRGREIISKTVPTDVFESMRLMSAKKALKGESIKPEIQTPREGKAEVFHEGYVDGKLFLVPDSNLEAMRDIVNFKMRPRRSVRYKHQTSYEISDYDHFRKKLSHLLDKLDKMPSEGQTGPDEEKAAETKPEEKENTEEEEKAEEEEKDEEEEERKGQKKDQIAGESEEEEEEEEHEEQSRIKDESAVESEEDEEEEEEQVSRLKDQNAGEDEEEIEEEQLSILKDHSAGEVEEEMEEEMEEEQLRRLKEQSAGENEEETGRWSQTESETESEEDSEVEHDTIPKESTKYDYRRNNYVDIEEGTERWSQTESEEDSEVEHDTIPKESTKYDYRRNNYVDIEEGTESRNITESDSVNGLDRLHLRFLISGHFKKGRKPIYIIQEYNGESLFKDQNTDIFTSEKNGDIDILIAGKYYNENILEEIHGKPLALNIKPKKIIIDENRSKVYEEYFEYVFNMKTADIFVKGQFLTNEITKRVTPFIRFGVKRKYPIE